MRSDAPAKWQMSWMRRSQYFLRRIGMKLYPVEFILGDGRLGSFS